MEGFARQNGFFSLSGLGPGGSSSGPTPAEQIAALFANGEQGGAWMPWVTSSLWQNTSATTPAGNNDFVARIDDLSGNNNHLLVDAGDTDRPQRIDDGSIVDLWVDGVNDQLLATIPVALTPGWTTIVVFDRGNNDDASVIARIAANSDSNDYIRLRTAASQRGQGATRALSQAIDVVSTTASPVNSFPINTRHLLSFVVRDNTGNNEFRIDGEIEGQVASNWPAALELGTSSQFLVPQENAYTNGRFCGGMTINRELSSGELEMAETIFGVMGGVFMAMMMDGFAYTDPDGNLYVGS